MTQHSPAKREQDVRLGEHGVPNCSKGPPRNYLDRLLYRFASLMILAVACVAPVSAETLNGTALIRERIALPPGTTFEAVIEDIARADASAIPLARTVIEDPGQPPIDFAIEYDPAALDPRAIYSLRATIRRDGHILFTTDTVTRVLEEEGPQTVEVMLQMVRQGASGSARSLPAHGLRLPATFRGTLPCADCSGIRHHLDLWPDQYYHMRREWLGDAEGTLRRDELGRWYPDPARGAIVLYGASEMPLFWEVKAPGRLRQMDMQGNPIESDLLPYDLTGDGTLGPTDLDHLFLAGEALIGTDGLSLRECLTGRVYPIETDGAFADLLQAVEAQRDTAETPLLVSLNARITQPEPGLAPRFPWLTVLRFVNAFPDESCDRPAPKAALTNTYWRIETLMGEGLMPQANRREPHIALLDLPEAQFRATVGCNQIIGRYDAEGSALTFAPAASTMTACPPPLDRMERQLLDALEASQTFRKERQAIVLRDVDGNITANLTAIYLR